MVVARDGTAASRVADGIVASGGEGPYRMSLGATALPPSADREPNDAAEQASPVQEAST